MSYMWPVCQFYVLRYYRYVICCGQNTFRRVNFIDLFVYLTILLKLVLVLLLHIKPLVYMYTIYPIYIFMYVYDCI